MLGIFGLEKKIIVMLGLIMVSINVFLWITGPDTANVIYYSSQPWQDFSQFSATHVHFKGFGWFFKYMSTFPGPMQTIGAFQTWGNVIQNFHITDNDIVNSLLVIPRLITMPILLLQTIVVDIYNNIAWFIGLMINN